MGKMKTTQWLVLAAGFIMQPTHLAFGQDAEAFIQKVEKSPPNQRPPDWERTKSLMARRPPEVGQPAPDFTLKSLDGSKTVTRSKLASGKPQVLIFGSYT